MENHTIGIEIGLVFEHSSSLLSKSHEIPDIFIWSNHLDFCNRLLYMDIGSRFWYIFRIGDIEIGAFSSLEFDEFSSSTRIECYFISSDEELVGNLRTRDDDVHIIFSPETFFHDIEMEEPEESTTKSISKSWRRLMFSDE